MKQEKKNAKNEFETFYELFKSQRTTTPNKQGKDELLKEAMLQIETLSSELNQEKKKNAKLNQQLKESHKLYKRLQLKMTKSIEKYQKRIEEDKINYLDMQKQFGRYKYSAAHNLELPSKGEMQMNLEESSLIGNHPSNPHQQKYLLKYQSPTSLKIVFKGQHGFRDNFINKTPIKTGQIAKYSVTIPKWPEFLMIGFCTEKSLGRQYNHCLDECYYLYCRGKGYFENGAFRRIRIRIDTHDTIVCIADLENNKIIWAKDSKPFAEAMIPMEMREKSWYFSLLQNTFDSVIELSI